MRRGPVACIGAEEAYIFEELAAPFPFLRLEIGKYAQATDFLEYVTGLAGCSGVMERTAQLALSVFVMNAHSLRRNDCMISIGKMLQRAGYRVEGFELSAPPFRVYYAPREPIALRAVVGR